MNDLAHSESRDKQKEKYLRILNSGTVREKALMLGNNLAEDKEFLTNEEVTALVNSMNPDKETHTFNQYRKIYDSINNFLPTVNQIKLSYSLELSELDKLIVIKNGYSDIEQAVNTVLQFIPDIDTKRKVITKVNDAHTNPFNYKPHLITCLIGEADDDDEKGNLTKEGSLKIFSNLDEKIKAQLNRVKTEQIRLKSSIFALRDFMRGKKFTIRAFSKYLNDVEAWARKDKNEMLAIKVNFSLSNLDNSIREPKYEEIGIDKEQYDNFMEYLLNGR